MNDEMLTPDIGDDDDGLEPLAWLDLLEQQVEVQRKHARHYDRYYANEAELEIVKNEYEEVFGPAALDPPRTNLSAVGVNAAAERLVTAGFMVGEVGEHSSGEGARAEASAAADVIWRRNDLDVMESVANVETLVKARTFLLVWPDGQGRATVTVEDPEQMAVIRRPSPPYDVVAAAKFWEDLFGRERAVLWLPDGMRKFEKAPRGGGQLYALPTSDRQVRSKWRERERAFFPQPAVWAGRVPVAEMANRDRLLRDPQSDLVDVAPLADSHSKVLADLIIACSFGAVPIRTATGITLAKGPDGKPVPPFDIRADRAMVSEKDAAKFGTLPAADLAGYVAALEQLLAQVRIVTRVPAHYYGQGTSSGLAGETIKAAEGSLVRRVDGLKRPFGWARRTMMSLALDLERPDLAGMPVRERWAETETRVESQIVDATQKLAEILPTRILLRDWLKLEPAVVEEAMELREAAQARADEILQAVRYDLQPREPSATMPAEPTAA